MPTTKIARLGEVEYVTASLPSAVKGKTLVGKLDFPILIDERLEPGTKLDYVVAHEAGHKLTIDMLVLAVKESPKFFENNRNPMTNLLAWMLTRTDAEHLSRLNFRHPETKANFKSWVKTLLTTTNDLPLDSAREAIAELFAQWATEEGQVGPQLDSFFTRLITKKHAGVLPTQQEEPSSTVVAESRQVMPDWFDPHAKFRKGGEQ